MCSRFGPTSSSSLTQATLRGHAPNGHPCPDGAWRASLPAIPLRVACVRPAPKSRFVVSGLAWMKSKSEGKGKGKNQAALVLLIVPHAPRGNAAPDAPRPVTRSVTTSATTRSVGAIIVCRAAISQTPQGATLEGRAQALRRGQRGMDAALAAPGHGWPMAACPRSNAGAREPDEGGPDTGANGLVTLPRQSNAP